MEIILTESPVMLWVSRVIDRFLCCRSCGVLVFQCEKVLIKKNPSIFICLNHSEKSLISDVSYLERKDCPH
jgi:hypothetical protein